jgi:RNA polymerase sigma-70 factor, ECF subfamily
MNRVRTSGVWLNEAVMNACAGDLPGSLVIADASLQREFERRLSDCPTLAYRVALGVLRNPAEAEDVAQEAMLRAYRNFHRLRDRDRFRAWLVRTAWRLALDRIRAVGRRERRERVAGENWPESSVEAVAANRELAERVGAALDRLPEKLRIVMLLAAVEGYNTHEVAALLNLAVGTVKSRLFTARKRLAESLKWSASNTPNG